MGALAGPSHSPGAMSGRPGAASGQMPGEPGSKGTKRGKGGPERGEARQRGQAALAVQGAIAAGTALTHLCFGGRSEACTQQAFCTAGSSEMGVALLRASWGYCMTHPTHMKLHISHLEHCQTHANARWAHPRLTSRLLKVLYSLCRAP